MILKRLKKICEKNAKMRIIYQFSEDTYRKIIYNFYKKKTTIQEKTVLFESYRGKYITCNPKALYLAMLKDTAFRDFSFVWVVNDKEKYNYLLKNRNTTFVKRMTPEYYRAMAGAGYIIANAAIPGFMILKKNQIYVQTWHGTPLKRLGCDIAVKGNASVSLKKIHKQYRENGSKFTYLLSPSAYVSEKLCSAYDIPQEKRKNLIIEKGYPRNDYLFQYTYKDQEKIKKKLNIPEDKKIILYAPTFRDNHYEFTLGFCYQWAIDFKKLKQTLGEEYVFLIRAHYFINQKMELSEFAGFIYDVSEYDDINELYIISNILVTDYSSVFFDFANLKRPILFFMYDLKEYQNEIRDFYLDLSELPGPIVTTQDELVKAIKENKDTQKFQLNETYQEFAEKFNNLDDDKSSQRVLNQIFNREA